jgi:hypothetical protein
MTEPTFTTKLGTTKRAGPRSRIWLEGNRLLANSFNCGDLLHRQWHLDEHYLVLRVVSPAEWLELDRVVRSRVSGRIDRPVIDITGADVAACFRTERVACLFSKRGSRVVISEVY